MNLKLEIYFFLYCKRHNFAEYHKVVFPFKKKSVDESQ